MKGIVRDQFKDNMDSVFDYLTGSGKGGKVTNLFINQLKEF